MSEPSKPASVAGLNHVNVLTADMAASVAFYTQLGFTVGHRPEFPTTGTWLYLSENPVLHLNDRPSEEMAGRKQGPVHHFGFSVHGTVEETTQHLESLGITYDLWDPLPGVCRALYFLGPSGEEIEYVFVDVFVPLGVEHEHRASEPV